ncbi:T9SS type A sorting domain-containing protein [Flavivirga algicola]|uniref:T9SS type A sorting domain-containing protein n=1 Tax=Flavivirga algicola TaxID=2729136 RepID=A0ABX1RW74_9FLAO|nr:T9SS type A sorting domain-containing protein [Flavivirga algicola]NMH87411.1 T9SS type A sorting domain-containing protein [Flavivirga algicola]
MKSLTFLIICLCVVSFGFGQEIISYSSNANAACSGVISFDSNIDLASSSGVCRGSGITANAGGTYNSRGWTTSSSIDANDYLEWTVTPDLGYEIDLTTMDLTYDRSGSGPTMVDIQVDTGSGFSSVFTDASVSPGTEDNNGIDLSAYTNITGTITFRLYAFNATLAAGTFDIDENTATDKGIIINGSVNALPACSGLTTTWNGVTWDNGVPNLTMPAVINSSYNTSTASLSVCSLTVNNNSTLTVNDNTFIEIQNDITVDAGSTINVRPYGSVVQNDDAGVITNNGTMVVTKTTSPLSNWYEYTYWSSPVFGETIGSGLSDSDVNRRFSFNAANFEDATMETANDNTAVAGQDDIDDNGDDWSFVSGATTMTPGIGYAAMHKESVFVGPGSPPYQFDYTFTGDFNNGIITVPVVRNDGSSLDNNWNLIGNPYPSAISISDFFTQNTYNAATNTAGTLEGAIYLWSQNTPPSSTANGNQRLNFATSDYATHNGTGGAAGGDGVTPNGYIPSGQGFFVSYSQTRPSSSGNVIFNNAMRGTTNDNSQFFKNSNSKKKSSNSDVNKIWVNLTSDNGVYNQILVGYVNGATNDDDGTFYDAHKIVAPTTYAALYSNIENSNKKFAIQGKDPNSINNDEVIKLGFKTIIDVATLYKLSIAKLQGAFLTNNTIYLKDNLLNKLHDLSASNYTFTSEVGEFNDRFEIVFNASAALSTDDISSNKNDLSIVELDNDRVQFKSSNSTSIKTVAIFDLLGRQLYLFEGQKNAETYTLSNLNSSIYIAEVALSNGAVISKKAVKK